MANQQLQIVFLLARPHTYPVQFLLMSVPDMEILEKQSKTHENMQSTCLEKNTGNYGSRGAVDPLLGMTLFKC